MGDAAVTVLRDPRGVATVTMDRAEVRNAFDGRLVRELAAAAVDVAEDPGVRVVVLTGAGTAFSAGADLDTMRAMGAGAYEDNVAEATRTAGMLRALYELPKPLVGRINGHALGGGAGLAAVCDVAVAVSDATFGFTEVRLGLAPAVISPYVVRKVGRSFACAHFVTGERFGAERARQAGLVHQLVAAEGLDAAVGEVVERCLLAGPRAAAVAKRLPEVALGPLDEVVDQTVEAIADLRAGEEGQEGIAAFLERRPPSWASGR